MQAAAARLAARDSDLATPLLDFGRIEAEIAQGQAQSHIVFAELRRSTFVAFAEVEGAFGRLTAADRNA